MKTELTKREQEVYHELVTNPGTLVQISEKLYISRSTMTTHRQNIYSKLGVDSRVELIIQHYREEINRRKEDE